MSDTTQIQISVVLDDGSIRQAFVRIEQEADSSASRITDIFAGIALEKIFEKALEGVKEFVKGTIEAAAKSEDAITHLGNALAIAGSNSREAVNSFIELAKQLSETSKFSETAILGVEAIARSYTKTNEQAKLLTKAAVDMSARLGIDADSAARQIGATFAGTIPRDLRKTVTELANLTSEQLKSGAGLDAIAAKFKGAASNEAQTFATQVAQVKNAFEEFQIAIGKFIDSSPAVRAALDVVKTVLRDLTIAVGKIKGGQDDVFKPLILSAIQVGYVLNNFVIIPFQVTAAAVRAAIDTLAQVIFGVLGDIAGFAGRIVTAISPTSAIGNKLLAFKDFAADMFRDLGKDAEQKFKQIDTAWSGKNAIEDFLDRLYLKISKTSGALIDIAKRAGDLTAPISEAKDGVQSLGEAFQLMFDGIKPGFNEFYKTSTKVFSEVGVVAIKGLAGGVAQGMAAIGKALVTGQNLFKAFAGAMLSALGQAAIQMGATYILMGIARAFSSYGLDPTATGLIATGSAMSVLGGALIAIGGGVSGGSASLPNTSGGGGGSLGSGNAINQLNPADQFTRDTKPQVTVHIEGSVFDSKETGIRIVDIINDSFNTQGTKVQTA